MNKMYRPRLKKNKISSYQKSLFSLMILLIVTGMIFAWVFKNRAAYYDTILHIYEVNFGFYALCLILSTCIIAFLVRYSQKMEKEWFLKAMRNFSGAYLIGIVLMLMISFSKVMHLGYICDAGGTSISNPRLDLYKCHFLPQYFNVLSYVCWLLLVAEGASLILVLFSPKKEVLPSHETDSQKKIFAGVLILALFAPILAHLFWLYI